SRLPQRSKYNVEHSFLKNLSAAAAPEVAAPQCVSTCAAAARQRAARAHGRACKGLIGTSKIQLFDLSNAFPWSTLSQGERVQSLSRQKPRHCLAIFLRLFIEHPMLRVVDHHRLRARKMPRQQAVHHGEASRGIAAADEQRR